MDGENNGSKPYEQMDDLGVPLFLETPIYIYIWLSRNIVRKLLFEEMTSYFQLCDFNYIYAVDFF